MNFIKCTMAALALSALAACGGGDTEDRLDIADPKVRFVHAIALGPDVTLFREAIAQSDANDVGYKYASRYFDVSPGNATWSFRTADTASVELASVAFDAKRGDRNTIVALPGSAGAEALLIQDPYNKGLTSDKARVRVLNAAINAQNVDVYFTQAADDLAARSPDFAAVQFKQSVPGSGADSLEVSGGSYQLRITTAGTKDVIFSAPVTVSNNADWLVLAIPSGGIGVVVPNDIKVLVAQGNDSANGATTEITTAP